MQIPSPVPRTPESISGDRKQSITYFEFAAGFIDILSSGATRGVIKWADHLKIGEVKSPDATS